MALFELKQDTGSGAAAPWAPPTFKDCVAADIDAAFFEENEHADRHTVDGKDMLNPLTVVNLTFRAAQQVHCQGPVFEPDARGAATARKEET